MDTITILIDPQRVYARNVLTTHKSTRLLIIHTLLYTSSYIIPYYVICFVIIIITKCVFNCIQFLEVKCSKSSIFYSNSARKINSWIGTKYTTARHMTERQWPQHETYHYHHECHISLEKPPQRGGIRFLVIIILFLSKDGRAK